MQNVILSTYKILRDSDTITQGYRVVEKMENNPIFSDPPPALAETKKLLPELQSAVGNAKGRDVEAVALKNKLKAEVIALLTVLAEYVTVMCKGDRLNLLSSGFPISGASSTQIDQIISPLEVEIGAPGVASTSLKRLRGARVYMHQYTAEPPALETVWHSEVSKFSVHTFNGLTSMAKYWFRVVAISAAGEKLTTQVVERVIQ
ncbi:hypothetical protein FAM09_23070 [Niastella caeni]|uniref:Fibronectin type III domain-containing protein n=1 Tax=Niastella caeni TaxID=2569763 RepID=A0A4S8HI43_9BACT|nr:hypothetical protein [Niastella caeni]THU34878.1 hypothetical protein FAM09_23070 [Niastella caeni]